MHLLNWLEHRLWSRAPIVHARPLLQRLFVLGLTLTALLFFSISVSADELKPAYLELTETSTGTWQIYYKTSARSRLARQGELSIPEPCTTLAPLSARIESGNQIQTGSMLCETSLSGHSIGIQGLSSTNTDALVRLQSLSHPLVTLRLTPREPHATVPLADTSALISNVAWTYTVIGIEHIVWGYDHLLFVLAMVLLLSGWQRIVWTVTAFTVAHSLTLVGTTLGWFALASRPVEAIIALSILFLAVEIFKKRPGELRFSERAPWLVAFSFGLLHGFGFAGALAEIGLPANDVPLALFSFNLGVEIGQLAIVAVALIVLHVLRRWQPLVTERVVMVSTYGIGITASFWFIERLIT